MAKIITMDTNVLVAALMSNLGASHYILRLILAEKIQLALTPPVYFEYYDVLTPPEILAKIHLSIKEIGTGSLNGNASQKGNFKD